MSVEIFVGKKLEEVLKDIQVKYGGNYKIIEQKKQKKFLWRTNYEVKILVDEKETLKQKVSAPKIEDKELILALLENTKIPAPKKEIEQTKPMATMKEVAHKLQETQTTDTDTNIFEQLLEKLVEQDEVDRSIAATLIEEVKLAIQPQEWGNETLINTTLLQAIEQRIRVTGPLDVETIQTIALVGPTGVGKTTTIAKISAILKQQKKKIGLISTDVYRIGAIEQLQTYANIMDSKMIEAKNPQELKEAINYFKHVEKVDIILIDTVGRSPMKVELVDGTKEYLDIAKPDHTALVLSSTQKCKDMIQILKNFDTVPLDSLIFTKLDETMSYGFILNILEKNKLNISYVTNGQNVPKDIVAASANHLANKILNGDEQDGSSSITA